MIEYLHDVIRATAGENVCICAELTDNEGKAITANCHLMLFDSLSLLETIMGTYDGEQWSFIIPAEKTAGRQGRYWYCICADNESLCFKRPIYFI